MLWLWCLQLHIRSYQIMRSERGHSAAPCIFTTMAEVLGREAGIAECPGWAIEAHRPSPGILLRLPGRFACLDQRQAFFL